MVLNWRFCLVAQLTVRPLNWLYVVIFTVGGRIVGVPMRLYPGQAASVAFDQRGPFVKNLLDHQERV